MSRLSKHFDSSEFRCPCCGKVIVAERLIQGLQKLRDKIGVPLFVTSGYRCEKYNASPKIKGAQNSYHCQGMAADVTGRVPLVRLYFEALGIPEFRDGGVGLYPDENFIHVDCRTYRSRWGRVDGKYTTIHKALERLQEKRKK